LQKKNDEQIFSSISFNISPMAAKTFCNSWSHKFEGKKTASYSFFRNFYFTRGVGVFFGEKNDGHQKNEKKMMDMR